MGQSASTHAWLAILAAATPVVFAGGAGVQWIALWRATARNAIGVATEQHAIAMFAGGWVLWKGGWLVIGAAWLGACIAAVATAAASGVLGFSPGALQWRLERLSWRNGVRQLVSSEGLLAAGTALSASVLVLVCGWPAAREIVELAAAGEPPAAWILGVGQALYGMWWRLAVALGLLALFDLWRVRRRTGLALRMSPREVREERAEAEGKPDLKARRRASASRTARTVNAGAIRRATAVIANPTHIAVALRYAPPLVVVPVVVSLGADSAAVLVRAIAGLHDIPVIESPELARTLFARATLGEPIPEDCYAAVAAVFALLLQTRGLLRGTDDG